MEDAMFSVIELIEAILALLTAVGIGITAIATTVTAVAVIILCVITLATKKKKGSCGCKHHAENGENS